MWCYDNTPEDRKSITTAGKYEQVIKFKRAHTCHDSHIHSQIVRDPTLLLLLPAHLPLLLLTSTASPSPSPPPHHAYNYNATPPFPYPL